MGTPLRVVAAIYRVYFFCFFFSNNYVSAHTLWYFCFWFERKRKINLDGRFRKGGVSVLVLRRTSLVSALLYLTEGRDSVLEIARSASSDVSSLTPLYTPLEHTVSKTTPISP